MGKRPQPQRIRLNGRVLVVVTPEEHQHLLASRRQLGAANVQRRTLARQIERLQAVLAEAARHIEHLPHPPTCDPDARPAAFPRCRVCGLSETIAHALPPKAD